MAGTTWSETSNRTKKLVSIFADLAKHILSGYRLLDDHSLYNLNENFAGTIEMCGLCFGCS